MTRPQNIEYGPQPWGEKEWCSIIITEEHVAIHKVIECLGLKLANQPGRKIKFEHEDCSTLAKKVADLSRELALDLQKKPNTSSETSNLLFAFAKKQSSLKNELENLLKEHGSRIWGESVARSHLLEPDPSTKYTGDLFYENEGHKNILEENIRRWIILKTFNAIKGAKKSKKRDNDKQITGGNNEGLKRQISTVLANPNNDGRYLTAV
ncbi:hypothetical protein J3E74DRAFT_412414 [Bipolaris maydis]|nr:hypothetical protein J3E74DRAFT_412414 [Bipolaris maydis]